MRVTGTQSRAVLLSRIMDKQSRLLDVQEQAASGLRVTKATDDTAAAALARRLDSEMTGLLSFEATSLQAKSRLEASDSALNSIGNQLLRAKEIALQHANETVNADNRTVAAGEANEIFESLIALGNTRVGGEYIFNSLASHANPFDAAGAYVGDIRIAEVELSPGVTVQSGADTFSTFTASVPGAVDIIPVVERLGIALAADNTAGIQTALAEIDTALQQVRNGRSSVGPLVNRVDAAEEVRDSFMLRLKEQRSGAVDADMARTLSDMTLISHSLDAALSVTARSLSLSILDKLR